MESGQYVYKSDFAKRHYGRGFSEGKAGSVLAVLEARGISITEEQKRRILDCTDLSLLDR